MSTQQIPEEYTPEQERVSQYLRQLTEGQVGSGPDPIGFLLASHAELARQNQQRVDSYLGGGEYTQQGVTNLMNTLWNTARSPVKAEEKVAELSFLVGVSVAYLQEFRKLLSEQERDSQDD